MNPGLRSAPLWLAWLGGVTFIVLGLVQGWTRPGYDPWQQSLSALSLGPSGWVQQLNFVMFGTLLLAAAPAWQILLRGARGARSYPVLAAISGFGFILAGFVPQDPAPATIPWASPFPSPPPQGFCISRSPGSPSWLRRPGS